MNQPVGPLDVDREAQPAGSFAICDVLLAESNTMAGALAEPTDRN